jgi:hypothetical protein
MKTTALVFIIVLTAHISLGQTDSCQNPDSGILEAPSIGGNSPVPEGYRLDIAGAYPVFGDYTVPLYGRIDICMAGVLQIGYSNEGYIGNLIGVTRSCNSWDAKVQILRQRDQLPSVALWIRGTIGWQKESLGENDLWGRVPANRFFGVLWTHYEFNSTALGLTMEPGLGENVALNLSVGYREMESRDLWIISMVYPGFGDSYHAVSGDRASLIEGSANLMVRPLARIAVILQVGTLPYYQLNQVAMKLDMGRAYLGTIGMRYSLPIPVFVDGYVRWQSAFNGRADTQVRLGLSSDVNLN